MTYSLDFRRHVLATRETECLTFEEVSARFSVGIGSVVRWSKRPEPKAVREGRPRKIDLDALARDVSERPDDYQYERAARFGVTQNAIFLALKKLDLTHKKSTAASES